MNPAVLGPLLNMATISLLKYALTSPFSGATAHPPSELPAFCLGPSLFSEQTVFSTGCILLLSQSRIQFLRLQIFI